MNIHKGLTNEDGSNRMYRIFHNHGNPIRTNRLHRIKGETKKHYEARRKAAAATK